jgi:nucleotide-binding universal stress UspA family protein
MIISASYRTDIPAFYSAWLKARIEAGYARVPNPYSGKPSRVGLRPEEVDGYVFWTRNARPARAIFETLAADRMPFVVQYTVTGYPSSLEQSVPPVEATIADIVSLSEQFGSRAVVWRYDPVFWSSLTPPDFHRENVARLARQLSGSVDEVTFSAAHIYRKTRRNTEESARKSGFEWRDPEPEEKAALLQELAAISAEAGLRPTLCSQPDLLGGDLSPARCIDADRLADIAGHPLKSRQKGNRPGCLCAESRDIGSYDSCPHGCVYCYAVERRERAKTALKRHDPAGEMLLPPEPAG